MNAFKITLSRALGWVLPERVKKSLFHLSFHLAYDEFQKFAHYYGFAPNMELGLTAMAERGFRPNTIVDVGAFEGEWSKLARRIWPSARTFMIEANVAKGSLLAEVAKQLDATVFCELLGAENGREVQFHLMESGSSVLAERSAVPRVVETRALRRLDSLLQDIRPPALLKIDTQGYELAVLEGVSTKLAEFEAVLLEVAIIEINDGAPLLHEVVSFMKARGYIAYDILEIHRRPLDNALNQIDIVFIREQSTLISDKRHFA
jgi:FkbM family methyltransferase